VVTKLLSRKYCKTVASKLYTQDTFSIQVWVSIDKHFFIVCAKSTVRHGVEINNRCKSRSNI
jgi:hypothetical protein